MRVAEELRSRIKQRLAELPPDADPKEATRIRFEEADRAGAELDRIHAKSVAVISPMIFPLQ